MKKSVIVKGERGTCPTAAEHDRVVYSGKIAGQNNESSDVQEDLRGTEYGKEPELAEVVNRPQSGWGQR